jgi:hypothetical protein
MEPFHYMLLIWLALGCGSGLVTYLSAFIIQRRIPGRPLAAGLIGWLVWVAASSGLIAILFLQADAAAAAISQRNIGIPFIYLSLWLGCSLLFPLIGLAIYLARRLLSTDE